MTTRREQRQQDINTIIRWMFMMPFIAVVELAAVTDLQQNRVYRLLNDLADEGLVAKVRLGWLFNVQDRWFLTTSGVLWAIEHLGLELQWQVTENGVKWLLRRLAMVEVFYRLTCNLWRHDGVQMRDDVYRSPDPDLDPIPFSRENRMRQFVWFRSSLIHAIHISDIGAWVPFTWMGLTTTAHRMADTVAEWMDILNRPMGPGLAHPTPAGWVSVGLDRLSATLAASAWPWPIAMSLTADGRVLKEMEPGPFTGALKEPVKPLKLGHPERIVDWIDDRHKSKIWAIKNPLAFRVFLEIHQWFSISLEQLERKFPDSTTSLPRVLGDLVDAKLVVQLDGRYYPDLPGMTVLANMDRSSPRTVAATFRSLLNEDGLHRRRLERHDPAVIDVALKLESETDGLGALEVANGWRYVIQVDPDIQINPDAMVYMGDPDHKVPFYLETEFTADDRRKIRDKLRPHRRLLQRDGTLLPLVVVCANRKMEELFWEVGRGLLMFTTTLDELLTGTSFGPESVWRYFGRPLPLNHLEILRLRREIDRRKEL